ncbi:hypothetical protein HYH03_003647 [Edaphochlamys debaryana]|uniref:Methyltransferase FkbM domain-containing protein n=1 Tax=Edaphochlamys debaryana TaxID=47281 RepID=A0A836C407_9CHLO|nr:hypothetical protein HYH03_003647 [Edaphochlamys debaryana]|eukprot:KAG2498388.1 hypothetical protein HYH03_003647 [Edaphochlamys debaryana]
MICQSLFYNHLSLGPTSRYHLIAGAASAGWGQVEIHVPEGRGDNAAISAVAATKNVGGKSKPEEVITFPMDDHLANMRRHRSVPAGGLKGIKIDTQGHEFYVIKGLNHTLAAAQQLVVFAENAVELTEAAGVKPSEVYSYMRGHGFRGYCEVDIEVSERDGKEVITASGTEETGNDIECKDIIWVKV